MTIGVMVDVADVHGQHAEPTRLAAAGTSIGGLAQRRGAEGAAVVAELLERIHERASRVARAEVESCGVEESRCSSQEARALGMAAAGMCQPTLEAQGEPSTAGVPTHASDGPKRLEGPRGAARADTNESVDVPRRDPGGLQIAERGVTARESLGRGAAAGA
jgi:hypothetical protein